MQSKSDLLIASLCAENDEKLYGYIEGLQKLITVYRVEEGRANADPQLLAFIKNASSNVDDWVEVLAACIVEQNRRRQDGAA